MEQTHTTLDDLIAAQSNAASLTTEIAAAAEVLLQRLGASYSGAVLFVHRSRDRTLDVIVSNTDPRNLAVAINAKLVSNGIMPPGVPSDHILAPADNDTVLQLRAELALAKASIAHMAATVRKAMPCQRDYPRGLLNEALVHAPDEKAIARQIREQEVIDAAIEFVQTEGADLARVCGIYERLEKSVNAAFPVPDDSNVVSISQR